MPLENIPLSGLTQLGPGLDRPEDVVVSRDNRIWASDASSACAEVLSDGRLRRVGRAGGHPNGINMDRKGRIIIANFMSGPVQRLDPETGEVEVLCAELEGEPLTSSNYPILDREGNIWCSHSTRTENWMDALDGRADGMLFRIRPDGRAEKMAEGIRFANGLALDADESHTYVCETSVCDVLAYPIRSDGRLGRPERYGPVLGKLPAAPIDPDVSLDPGALSELGLTDGCGFDQEGNLWVTLVAANRIVAITPKGKLVTVLADPKGEILRQPTNVSWGGPDMCDLYIGSITSSYILHARSPVPGLPLYHQR